MPGRPPADPITAKRLREVRERHGMTQKDVAKAIGVSQPLVQVWESGQSAPATVHLRSLAVLYGVTTDWLLGNDTQDEFRAAWPEGWSVLRRAVDELSPEKRRAMIRIMEAVLDAEKAEADPGHESGPEPHRPRR